MKALMVFTTGIFLSLSVLASENGLFYSEGPEKGQSALDYIGYYEMCYTGNPFAVRNKTLDALNGDIEKESSFVRVDKKNKQLVISYVDTKCLDDSLDATPASCRVWWAAPVCK